LLICPKAEIAVDVQKKAMTMSLLGVSDQQKKERFSSSLSQVGMQVHTFHF
jgi:hypothetical protein